MVDSAGCTGCKMKLSLWKRYLNSLDTLGDSSVDFLMVMNTVDGDELKNTLSILNLFLIMKKTIKLMAIVAIAAIGCIAGLQTLSSNSEDKPSAMTLANVEALSEGETGQECKWEYNIDGFGCPYHKCVPGGNGYLCHCGDEVH